VIEKVCF